MFRQCLAHDIDSMEPMSLNLRWIKCHPWLIRVPFFDAEEPDCVYVNAYSEKSQEYVLSKYNSENGDVIWQTHVVNGGYGTPAIFGDYVVALDGFDSIVFLNKHTGAQVHRVRYGSRVRSSICVHGGLCWFSHASHLVGMGSQFEVECDIHVRDAFLFGAITFYNDIVIVSGTVFSNLDNNAHKKVWAFDMYSHEIHYEVDLGPGRIISSDTSGAWIEGDNLLVSNNDEVFCLDADSGGTKWKQRVDGNVHRHVVVSDGTNVYFTTLKGVVGSLSLLDGHQNWAELMGERIVAPPTVIGGSLLVCSEGSVYVLDKTNGLAYQRNPVGHLPYSAACVFGTKVFIGAGEPPSNGILICFDIEPGYDHESPIAESFVTGATLDSRQLTICITTKDVFDKGIVDASVISPEGACTGVRLGNQKLVFSVPLKSSNLGGLYALPLSLCRGEKWESYIINVELKRTYQLPPSTRLTEFDRPVEEVTAFNSGSALIQMVNRVFGKDIQQVDFREIIDYLKEKSKWEDADFQTWRLIMKRALTSPAHTLDEFKELEAKSGIDTE